MMTFKIWRFLPFVPRTLVWVGLWVCTAIASAQELVRFPLINAGGTEAAESGTALLSYPTTTSPSGPLPAVVLLHSKWGWSDQHEGVGTYAQALRNAGFATLELRMFPNSSSARPGGPAAYLPDLFGALRFLAARPDIDAKRIAVAGYSFGGLLALVSATKWANVTYGNADLQFSAHAPFYPICWVFKANIKGRQSPVPTDAWLQWTGAPVRIYAGALDDYDDKDPGACRDAVDSLPDAQRKPFSVQVFPDATHGWDQPLAANFFEKLACKGKGCYNTNTPNRKAAEQSTKDLIEFLSRPAAQ